MLGAFMSLGFKDLRENDPMPPKIGKPVGFLLRGNRFMCPKCYTDYREHADNSDRGIAIYKENIGDYRQTCRICDTVLVFGKTDAWPELYK